MGSTHLTSLFNNFELFKNVDLLAKNKQFSLLLLKTNKIDLPLC